MPCPAISNAVPWSGLVRTSGRPRVTLTPFSTPRYFTGIRPWSWYMAITTSNSPARCGVLRARMNTVSGAKGPCTSSPSPRAAAMAGAITSSSSRPNSPPSPAWGLSPATPMRGTRPRLRCRAAWVMCSVCSTLSCVTAAIASRSDTWMLTSTVRSSSLASIMRTGIWASGTPWCAAASACNSSVCPGKSTPAADSASLCNGAVTSAATSPRNAARAAQTTLSAAARPAAALISPQGWGPGIPGSCSTGMQRGGASAASPGAPICATGTPGTPGRVMTPAARRTVARSPTTKQWRSASGASRKALATISGPMPAGSPWVMAMGCMGLKPKVPVALVDHAPLAMNK